jgi:hypothetical protein
MAEPRRFPPPWTVDEAQRAARMRPRLRRFQIVCRGLRLLFALLSVIDQLLRIVGRSSFDRLAGSKCNSFYTQCLRLN